MINSKISYALIFILFGLHLCIPLVVGGSVLIPEVMVSTYLLLSGCIVSAVRKKVIFNHLVILIVVAGVSILLSPDFVDYFTQHLRSLANLIFSLVVSFALVLFLERKERQVDMQVNLIVFIGVALILSVFEVYSPVFSTIVDDFRFMVFPDERLYLADWRDVNLFGFARPTLFGNEPSYLGITFAAAAVCLSLSRADLKTQIFAAALFLGGLVIARSVTAVAILGVIPAIFISDVVRKGIGKWKLFALLIGVCFFIGSSFVAMEMFGARVDQFFAGQDNSTDLRIFKPIEAAWISVSQSPLVGMGVGGRDKLVSDMLSLADWTQHTSYVLDRDRMANFFATGTFLIFAETGAMALLFMFLIYRAYRSILPSLRFYDFFVCFAFTSITMGGWTHPRIWLFVGLLLYFVNMRSWSYVQGERT